MKKYICLCTGLLVLASCQAPQKTQTLSWTQKSALKTCLMNESLAAVQNGTAFSADLSDLAQTLAKSCLRQQALQNLGIDEESAAWAQNILSAAIIEN